MTVRALLPKQAGEAERENFLQDAQFAMALSSRVQESGSIHVTDYGQDGPLAFLVKSEFSSNGVQPNPPLDDDDDEVQTQVRVPTPQSHPGLIPVDRGVEWKRSNLAAPGTSPGGFACL